MAEKYIALAEESTFRTAGTVPIYFKLLSENITTTREDFFPETTEYWTPTCKAEGLFRTSGSFNVLMEAIQWPKLLVFFIGDGSSTGADEYTHTWKFGKDETVTPGGVKIKPFTTFIGQGIEKDRQIEGSVIESININANAREEVRTEISVLGSGKETLITAKTPDYSSYSADCGYLTFEDATTMTVGGTDRLTTDPTIENFTLTLGRGYDADHYVLGDRFWAYPTLSGMAEVTGSMDFTFKSQDEHERFLSAVGTYSAGDQSSFEIKLHLRGGLISGVSYYYVEITIPKAYYTVSRTPVSARDRIVQTVEFRGIYDSTSECACQIKAMNQTSDYASLTN